MRPTMETARATLLRSFGYADFRPGQVDVVASVLAGNDTLAVLPTGGGKSLCYQVPALVLPGLTIVISPLISLMKDQVDRLEGRGLCATFLNSTLAPSDVSRRLARAASGELKLLYVAPERFEGRDLLRALSRCRLALLAIDEAHCISEWGHDFRPSFRRIASGREKLGNPQTIALTATATPAVRGDIVRQLRLRQPRVIVAGFDRENLHYAVRTCGTDADKDGGLIAALREHHHPAIVYASTRASVERIARHVTRLGIRAVAYHGGLDHEHRRGVQEDFMGGAVNIIVATNAFGMGIDKANVRLVVHHAMPGTLEAYYQEAGRAGRDGKAAHCLLLHTYRDRFTHEWFIRGMYPARQVVERVYTALVGMNANGRIPDDGGVIARSAKVETREAESALRLLEREHIIARQGGSTVLHVRLLATPTRVRREMCAESHTAELEVLRALWRLRGMGLYEGTTLDLDLLETDGAGREARRVIERLRDRQFVDCTAPLEGRYLSLPAAPFKALAIDWSGLARRRESDLAKLSEVQGYVYTKRCRRAFVLRYFGERQATTRCGGCDNCLPRRR
jgi:ATP-dependent DNA helicase RecQ